MIVKVWKTKNTAIVLVLAMDQQAMLIGVPGPTFPRTIITYWNLQWDGSQQWVSYFTSLGGQKCLVPGETLSS